MSARARECVTNLVFLICACTGRGCQPIHPSEMFAAMVQLHVALLVLSLVTPAREPVLQKVDRRLSPVLSGIVGVDENVEQPPSPVGRDAIGNGCLSRFVFGNGAVNMIHFLSETHNKDARPVYQMTGLQCEVGCV